MNNLLGSLGLGDVDMPGTIPPGKYAATVFKSEYVTHREKGAPEGAPKTQISHIITYRINDGGNFDGQEKTEFFPLARVTAFDENGNPATTEPNMPEKQKPWYKKRLTDLGVEESEIANLNVESLVGLPVTMGIKHNNGYVNVSFIELRTVPTQDSSSSVIGGL